VLTNKRLILTTKEMITTDTMDFSYDKISSVDYEKGLLTDRLTIHAMSSVEDILFSYAQRDKSRSCSIRSRDNANRSGRRDKKHRFGHWNFGILSLEFISPPNIGLLLRKL